MAAVIGISAFAIRAERAREEATRQTAVAVLGRTAADRERDAAAQAQAAAEAAATQAKRQVYRRLVNQLDMALDGPGRETARIFSVRPRLRIGRPTATTDGCRWNPRS